MSTRVVLPCVLFAACIAPGGPGGLRSTKSIDDPTSVLVPPAPDELGRAEGTLVGGRVRGDRSDIGMFDRDGAGMGCTGSLIGPTTVLTAAHCVDGRSSESGEASGRFYLPDGTSYETGRVRSYGDGSVGSDDVAIVELREPVPESSATPRGIASDYPEDGDRLETYGYGCTFRARAGTPGRGMADGRLRSVDRLEGGDSTALCPGDSGGPTENRDGDITGVNSGYQPTTTSSVDRNGTDIFGDPIARREDIESTRREWEMTPGGDPSAMPWRPTSTDMPETPEGSAETPTTPSDEPIYPGEEERRESGDTPTGDDPWASSPETPEGSRPEEPSPETPEGSTPEAPSPEASTPEGSGYEYTEPEEPTRETESTPESSPESTPESGCDPYYGCGESYPESSPESTPESSPESTPESSPESTPESSPESYPESSPESTPESSSSESYESSESAWAGSESSDYGGVESALRSVRDPCTAYARTCGGCTAIHGCGFCGASGQCVSINTAGAAVLGCASGLTTQVTACAADACGAYAPFKHFTCTGSGRSFARCGAAGAEFSYCPGGFTCVPGSTIARCYRR